MVRDREYKAENIAQRVQIVELTEELHQMQEEQQRLEHELLGYLRQRQDTPEINGSHQTGRNK